jgi:predicted GH43/DUF377 family glycosyl hydrolase
MKSSRLVMALFVLAMFLVEVAVLGVMIPKGRAQDAVSGLMVLDQGTESWEHYVWRPSVQYSNSIFTMWYSGESSQGESNIGVAFSTDGLVWARYGQNPVLTIGSPGAWDSGSVQEAWVIPSGGDYLMWYTGERLGENGTVLSSAIGFATSNDGLHWNKYARNPVLTAGPPGAWDDDLVFRPTVSYTGVSYVMYYQGMSTSGQIRIGTAISSNGTDWTKLVQPITMPSSGWNSYSSYLGASYKIVDQYVALLYGSPSSTSPPQIGFSKSPDGVTWNTYPASLIHPGNAGTWDDEGVILPSMVTVGTNYYFYYTGLQSNGGSRIGLSIMPVSQYPVPEFSSTVLIAPIALLVCAGLLRLTRRQSRNGRMAKIA